jgi:hypothetical protein
MRHIMRSRLTSLIAAGLAIGVIAAACGGDDGDGNGPTQSPTGAAPGVTACVECIITDLAVGPNRFAVILLDESNTPVVGSDVEFRLLPVGGDDSAALTVTDVTPIEVTRSFTQTLDDGSLQTVEVGQIAVHVANVDFDSAGFWEVEVTGNVDGQPVAPLPAAFEVTETSETPAIGQPAPASVQTILSDVDDISEIDTSDPPNPAMHDMTIADAVTSGKPTVIIFATPAFCVSRICGPTKEFVDDLWETYDDQVNFVHVEPWDIERARTGEGLFPLDFVTDDWGLPGEPWIFMIDSDGLVAAKFESIVSLEELEQALLPLLGSGN